MALRIRPDWQLGESTSIVNSPEASSPSWTMTVRDRVRSPFPDSRSADGKSSTRAPAASSVSVIPDASRRQFVVVPRPFATILSKRNPLFLFVLAAFRHEDSEVTSPNWIIVSFCRHRLILLYFAISNTELHTSRIPRTRRCNKGSPSNFPAAELFPALRVPTGPEISKQESS